MHLTRKTDCPYESKIINTEDKKSKNQLIIACVLCSIFAVSEIIGGIISNSLAILTDSVHLFSDLSSFVISLIALYLAKRPKSDLLTFGWHRAEVMGALISVITIWIVTAILVYEAVNRIIKSQYTIDANIMLIMSLLGVIINVILAFILNPHSHSHGLSSSTSNHHNHSHHPQQNHINASTDDDDDDVSEPLLSQIVTNSEDNYPYPYTLPSKHSHHKHYKPDNINIRAAFIHVIGDILQSVGTMISAFVIYFKPQYKIADPICTFIFSGLVIITTVQIMRDIVTVLMECRPITIPSTMSVLLRLKTVPGVLDVHKLRLWSVSLSYNVCMVHLTVDESKDPRLILEWCHSILESEFKLQDICIQLEQICASEFSKCFQDIVGIDDDDADINSIIPRTRRLSNTNIIIGVEGDNINNDDNNNNNSDKRVYSDGDNISCD